MDSPLEFVRQRSCNIGMATARISYFMRMSWTGTANNRNHYTCYNAWEAMTSVQHADAIWEPKLLCLRIFSAILSAKILLVGKWFTLGTLNFGSHKSCKINAALAASISASRDSSAVGKVFALAFHRIVLDKIIDRGRTFLFLFRKTWKYGNFIRSFY